MRGPLIASAVVLAALVAFGTWRVFFAGTAVPDNVVALSGRIEGDDSAIASKQPGRVVSVRVREGDSVSRGEILATLDDAQARAAVADAQARLQAARRALGTLQAQLREAQLSTTQAGVDVQGRIAQADSQVAAAQQQVAQQEAAYRLASFTANMDERLYRTGDLSKQQRNQAVSARQQTQAGLAAAQQNVRAAQGALAAAGAGLSNPPIREQQAAAVRSQIAQQQSVVAASAAQLVQAQANLRDLTVRAPFSGTVMVRTAEPGEVVAAGTPLVTLLNLDRVYLRGFIPEGEIGRVKLGQAAHIFLDSDPAHAIDAYVLRIDPQAMFTPENTYFRSDRVKEVFGVKLALRGGFGYAKPGMPADGEVLVSGAWPK